MGSLHTVTWQREKPRKTEFLEPENTSKEGALNCRSAILDAINGRRRSLICSAEISSNHLRTHRSISISSPQRVRPA